MTADPVQTVVDALRTVGKKVVAPRSAGGQWSAQCPAHDDKAPSLSISVGKEGRALVNCHAGCPTEVILGTLGLNVVELFPDADAKSSPDLLGWPGYRAALAAENTATALEPAPEPIRQRVATYVYTDADGAPVSRVVRFALVDSATGAIVSKSFSQQAADGRGGWRPGLAGVQPPLYQLPRVLAAVAAKLPVLVVEGEKDADAAASIGLVATCNAMGAGAWRDQHTATLAGASVLLIPDRDQPGINHARDVRTALIGVSATVAVFGAAAGKDLADHLAAGLALGDLQPVDLDKPESFLDPDDTAPPDPTEAEARILERLVTTEVRTQKARRIARRMLDSEEAAKDFRAPPFRPDLTAELALPDEAVIYRVELLMPSGANTTLTAQYKTGKTTTVNELVRSLVDGTPFLGRFATALADGARVAVFNHEVDERQYRRWLREVGIVNTDRVSLLNLRGYRLPLTVGHVEDWVVAWLVDHGIGFWIVDPFARSFVGSGDENSNADVGVFLDTLDVIKERAGVGELLLPIHTGRDTESGDRARGATRVDDWADVRWLLSKDNADNRYFKATGRDVEVAEEKLTYDSVTRRLTFGGGDKAWEEHRRVESTTVDIVRRTPGIPKFDLLEEIKKQCHVGPEKAKKARDTLIANGVLRTEPGLKNAIRHFLGGYVRD